MTKKFQVFRGSSKNGPFYTPEVFSRVALKPSNFEAEASKGFSSIFESLLIKDCSKIQGFSRVTLENIWNFKVRPWVRFLRILTTLVKTNESQFWRYKFSFPSGMCLRHKLVSLSQKSWKKSISTAPRASEAVLEVKSNETQFWR